MFKMKTIVTLLVLFVNLNAQEEITCNPVTENCLSSQSENDCVTKTKEVDEEPECSESPEENLLTLINQQ